MANYEKIKSKKIFYQIGVMCGNTLYLTYKFDDFEKTMQEACRINNKYKRDMRYCCFVIQAFKDNTYDFEKSCFYQSKIYVNEIEDEVENIVEGILNRFGE